MHSIRHSSIETESQLNSSASSGVSSNHDTNHTPSLHDAHHTSTPQQVETLDQGAGTPPRVGSTVGGILSPPNFLQNSQDLSLESANIAEDIAQSEAPGDSSSRAAESATDMAEDQATDPASVSESVVYSREGVPLPKDFKSNVSMRYNLLKECQKNTKLRGIQYQLCKLDVLYWVNLYTSTYNPRKTPSTIPFITYEYEDKLILDLVDRIKNQKDLLIEKSRDMGVTWCVLLAFTWYWQFHGEGQDFLVGSRKEQYIDVMGNMDTLLEKVRFLIRNQPKWLIPQKFDWKSHSNYLKIVNPDTKSTITGEATNNNFSRGGRRKAIFFDEFAFWDCDRSAWRASADSSNCRILVSTPFGFNNQFAKLRHSGAIEVITLHWKLHPEKDQAWYENECKRRNNDEVEIAQELDINYEGSETGLLFRWEDMKKAVHNEPIMSAERIVVSLDPSGEGDDEAVFYVCNNGNIVERKILDKTNDAELGSHAINLIHKYRAQVFICDAIGNGVISMVSVLLGKNENRVKIVAFDSRKKASNQVKYFNRRDEVYHLASEQMKSGNVQMDDDYTLMKQLNATKYQTDNGRIYISAKEDVKKSVGSSPDRADAWVLAVEGLKYTHSMSEIKQRENYRKVLSRQLEPVLSGEEYGSWGDYLD